MKNLLILLILTEVYCAKILIIYHVPSKSHCILGETFARGLSAKGHNVTMISPFKLKKDYENVKHILLDGVIEKMENFMMFAANQTERQFVQFSQFTEIVKIMTTAALESHAIENLLSKNNNNNNKNNEETFDLVMLDEFYNDAHYGIAHHFNASLIVTSSSLSDLTNHITGNPAPYSFVPTLITAFPHRMNFLQRVLNTISGLIGMIIINNVILVEQDTIYRQYFKNGPPLQHLRNNVSLAFVNTQPVIETPRPLMPKQIQIGGFHIEDVKSLPTDLQQFLDNSPKGFIYVSLGTSLKSSDLPENKVKALLKAFSRLQQNVVWKWEDDNLKDKPSNVWIDKWLPQQDILAHPKIKIFVTHGGLLSLTEAMFRNVPLVVIPFFGDQPSNAATVSSAGYGIRLFPEDITEESVFNALQDVLSNPKYSEEMTRRSLIINDQPLKPLDVAIYWVEHILRHGGGSHLHSAATEINIVQYLLLDVVVFCFAIFAIIISGLYYGIKFCCRCRKINQNGNMKKNH